MGLPSSNRAPAAVGEVELAAIRSGDVLMASAGHLRGLSRTREEELRKAVAEPEHHLGVLVEALLIGQVELERICQPVDQVEDRRHVEDVLDGLVRQALVAAT